jgi:regulatory protein
MDCLARREHSFYELQQKLCKKYPDVSPDKINSVLEVLRIENLQSDERFVESYVRYRKSRGFGYLHIKSDLSARRVNEALIDSYLVPDDSQDEMIQSLVLKKLNGERSLVYGCKLHRKIANFLQSRGFTHEQVRKGLDPWLVSS